ncbi:hypothetical protein B0H13DRAFT_2335476 [Mycena leptocephala]|nr:hypothetical protein B0H13DRAFT_2335476 [Mycena leptocephala]
MAPRLFEPVEIGTVGTDRAATRARHGHGRGNDGVSTARAVSKRPHRVVVAPLTRFKASAEHVPYVPLAAEYYAQRATRPGTPLITESTLIAVRAGGLANVPGIWGPARSRPGERMQVAAAVHAKGSFIFMQLWALGRVAEPTQLAAVGARPDLPIRLRVGRAADGPKCAPARAQRGRNGGVHRNIRQGGAERHRSGFDGVEVHSASRYLVSALAARHPTLAYLHLIEPRISGYELRAEGTVGARESNDALRAIWAPRPLIHAGGFGRANALAAADDGSLVAFGRVLISNPDLPTKLDQGWRGRFRKSISSCLELISVRLHMVLCGLSISPLLSIEETEMTLTSGPSCIPVFRFADAQVSMLSFDLPMAQPVTISRDIFTLPQPESSPAMHFQASQSRRVRLFSIAHNIAILLSRGYLAVVWTLDELREILEVLISKYDIQWVVPTPKAHLETYLTA